MIDISMKRIKAAIGISSASRSINRVQNETQKPVDKLVIGLSDESAKLLGEEEIQDPLDSQSYPDNIDIPKGEYDSWLG